MGMKLSTEFKELKSQFLEASANGESQEVQAELYSKMMDSLLEEAKKTAEKEVEGLVAQNPDDAKLSLREREFFNNIDKTAPAGIEKHLPQETVDRIFEDMIKAHPLLQHIGLKNASLRLKFLKGETSGVAVWGKIFDEIKGQLQQKFSDEESIQSKLTAFVVLPKDAEEYGPSWLARFVSVQINEAFAAALEAAFLNGDGDDKPIGLSRKLTGSVSGGATTYAAKDPAGTLTFANDKAIVKELTAVHKHHSVKEDGKTSVAVEGKLVMVVNPADAWDVKRQYTSLNAQGVYVTALPFNVTLIEVEAQQTGQVTTFVKGRYDAYVGGGISIKKYTETLALEDMNLYTAKQFAYGKAHDEKAAAVWTLSPSA